MMAKPKFHIEVDTKAMRELMKIKKAYIAGIKKGFIIDFEINPEAIEEAWQKYKKENL